MANRVDIAKARVLLVCGRSQTAQVLRTTFSLLNLKTVAVVPTAESALDVLKTHPFTAVFCDGATEEVGGIPFALAARRMPGVLDPMIPIFLIASFPNQKDVERARDEGVTDVLAQPVSAAVIGRKLRAALAHPRAFIAAADFFGPDRRVGVRRSFHGADRRKRSGRKVNVPPPPTSAA